MEWLENVVKLINSPFKKEVERKKQEFLSFRRKEPEEMFFELCFCFLTANTSADLGIKMQREVGLIPFINDDLDSLVLKLKESHYRFYNTRGKFIFHSRWIISELPVLLNHPDPWVAREFLVQNLKGIGYKEASHFLRNTGTFDFAILDKHVIRMIDHDFSASGKALSRKTYLHYEEQLKKISIGMNIEPGILDLYMWKIATGKMIK
jgi:N-glycosylase/DNA lyase